jgi:hypothetical protein
MLYGPYGATLTHVVQLLAEVRPYELMLTVRVTEKGAFVGCVMRQSDQWNASETQRKRHQNRTKRCTCTASSMQRDTSHTVCRPAYHSLYVYTRGRKVCVNHAHTALSRIGTSNG